MQLHKALGDTTRTHTAKNQSLGKDFVPVMHTFRPLIPDEEVLMWSSINAITALGTELE